MPNRALHRRREHTEPRRRTDEREPLDRHRDRLRLGTFTQADVDLVVLHRRIEELLDDRTQPMNLVDEEDVARTKIRECAYEIAGLFERRARRGADVHAKLACNQLREGGLAEARWAIEDRVIERLSTRQRGIDRQLKVVLHLLLADELVEPLRPERQSLDERPRPITLPAL